jgi:uncharacterized OB-fold protein
MGRFFTALRDGRILGVRGANGRIIVPPTEYDPVTSEPLSQLVEVGPAGVVTSWTWVPSPVDGNPLDRPFAWALIRLDGADTAMLHAVDGGTEALMTTGMRVRPRWRSSTEGNIRDIECFVPESAASESAVPTPGTEAVRSIRTPIRIEYQYSAGRVASRFLRAIAEGRIVGQRCPVCRRVYVPPRGSCPTDAVATEEEVELTHVGTITTFCVVNVPFKGLKLDLPYVAAQVLLDGAHIAFNHLIAEVPAHEVRMGMRVEAVWKPREEWGPTLENIAYFRPTGEPDAAYDTYKEYL